MFNDTDSYSLWVIINIAIKRGHWPHKRSNLFSYKIFHPGTWHDTKRWLSHLLLINADIVSTHNHMFKTEQLVLSWFTWFIHHEPLKCFSRHFSLLFIISEDFFWEGGATIDSSTTAGVCVALGRILLSLIPFLLNYCLSSLMSSYETRQRSKSEGR